jgi:flagellar basal body-associated protein FliL
MDKSKMMMIIIIALLVLLLGTVVGVGVYLISMNDGGGVETFQNHESPGTHGVIRPTDIVLVPVERITTVLAQGPGGRSDSVVADAHIGLNGTIPTAELDEFEAIVNRQLAMARNEIIRVFGSLTYDEVRTPEGKDAAAEIMKNRLQEMFDSNIIVNVSFSHWHPVRGR